jgi:Ca2+-binding RTX toxin-like protein
VSFAAGSATATLSIDPTNDTSIEADETVSLTLATGSGYIIGTTAAVTGTITNDDFSSSTTYTLSPTQSSLQLLGNKRINGIGNDLNNAIIGNSNNNKLYGLLGADTLTGGGTADTDVFAYNSLGESLLGTGISFDLITDFNNKDFILAPLTVETERLSSAIGSINSLASTSIEGLLTATSFAANAVSAFTVVGQLGTYIAMNDGQDGFQADTDAIVFLPNYAISNINFVEFI